MKIWLLLAKDYGFDAKVESLLKIPYCDDSFDIALMLLNIFLLHMLFLRLTNFLGLSKITA